VSAAAVLKAYPEAKIAIFDLDAHHGNGSEEIVKHLNNEYQSTRIKLFSVHVHEETKNQPKQNNFYPYDTLNTEADGDTVKAVFAPRWSEPCNTRAKKAGKAAADAKNEAQNKAAFRECVIELCDEMGTFAPNFIFMSTGFDAGKNDIGCCHAVSVESSWFLGID
jgi:acetoin utilization deacetylase AcuC-like enzyme